MSDVPEGLGSRGSALWLSLGFVEGTANGVLALEAARSADRLDELDSIIRGGDSSVLAEARQQQNVLRSMLVTLAAASEGSVGAVHRPVSTVDEFTARRRGRGA